jgi:magnesium-transporting ATPase (P-type)
MSDWLTNVTVFLSGVTMATFSAAGIFFIRFWRTSRDRFFLLFAIACWLVAVERVVALFIDSALEPLWGTSSESLFWVYLVRLFAFIAIAIAIYEKNRRTD